MFKFENLFGYFGHFGGCFVPEILTPSLSELDQNYQKVIPSEDFQNQLQYFLKTYAGRPTPLSYAHNLSKRYNVQIYLKREDLLHSGSHKLNNTLGQALLAKYLNKTSIIAETGAGQHGVATATACALLNLNCKIFMGEKDCQRQQLNVFKMEMLGAEVIPVVSGTRTLKDATNEALRYWSQHFESTHYIIGSVVGPHPYPSLVRSLQSVIGTECKQQIIEQTGRLPDACIACVGGGSNAIGLFSGFLDNNIKLIGVEAGGRGESHSNHSHCATLSKGSPGIFHGAHSYVLQDEDGQILPTHSISAGLDYPGVGPEHSYLKESQQATYASVTDQEAYQACHILAKEEGIICALESAHAVAYVLKNHQQWDSKDNIIINISGRGDKDMNQIVQIAQEGDLK